MKLLITGGKGMLGRTLQQEFADCELVIADLPETDITDAAGFDAFLAEHRPDAVIHCAAMTAVDRCESETELAYKLNAFGTANVAAACSRLGVRLVAISTDYVFDGDSDRPYNEFDRATGGHTVYGKSKFAGEEAVRTLCPGVARQLRRILANPKLAGTFHLTCEGEATWFEFAQEIFRLAGKDQNVAPCTTEEFPRPAPRPKNSRLDKMMLRLAGLPPMPDWRDALAEFMKSEFPG